MIELQITEEELQHLYDLVSLHSPDHSVKSKIEHELIADQIFDLLGALEDLNIDFSNEWQDKLWYDEQEDPQTIAVKRNRKLWTWETVEELQSIVHQLEAL